MKIWKYDNELDEYILINTFNDHTHSVRSFCQINDKYFASGSFDYTIKIWEIDTWKCVATLTGHESNVFGVITIKGNDRKQIIASCSNDKSIKLWEKDNEDD